MPVPVVNRTGGGGAIGYSHVKKQRPDGYSIIWNSNSISSTYHSGVLPFDYKAFDAVARVSVETPAIAVRADAPWKTLKEARRLRAGQSRQGARRQFRHRQPHPLLRLGAVRHRRGKIVDVPFGEGQAVVNLLGSRIEAVVQLPAALVSHVKSGDLKVLAVLGSSGIRCSRTCRPRTARLFGHARHVARHRRAQGRAQADRRQAAGRDQAHGRLAAVQGCRQGDRIRAGYCPADEFGKVIAHDDAKLAQLMTDLGLKKN